MDIKLSHNWLKEYLDTKAKPEKIAEALALSGPTVDRVNKIKGDYVYDIEITTNRVDSASIIGIAREASAILPQFKINAKLKPISYSLKTKPPSKPLTLQIKAPIKLTKRVMAVVIDNVSCIDSPKWMRDRLEASGIRSLNLLIDITNYVMLEIGHPTHVFDYDKITTHKLIFRLSKKDEQLTTLDNKTYKLPGNDIVIDDGKGAIVDLPGIMGTKNSVVSNDTKRIIFFIDNNDPLLMRKTSLNLGIRTFAVELNEKGVDPQLATQAFARGIDLYTKLAKGNVASKIYDIYPTKPKAKTIRVSLDFIASRLGVEVSESRVAEILTSLGFRVKSSKKIFDISIPSFRLSDIDIPEDIVEEVARIYGYHNLPSKLMTGKLPETVSANPFKFEYKIKQYLSGWGGVEVYNFSLVSKDMAGPNALKLNNPLGSDTEFLRTTLKPSMLSAAKQNAGIREPFHLFEMANVYKPQDKDLPQERMMLAGIFVNYDYRRAKGVIEALLEKLHITESQLINNFVRIDNTFYYEFEVEHLKKLSIDVVAFKPIPKYPPQIEDITFSFEGETKMGGVLHSIKQIHNIERVELVDIFKNAYTFRIWYQHPTKTLMNKDVEKIREKVIVLAKKKFGASIKS